ncbi:zinc-binding dehydrogenase, partial [Limosilactobacillus fermentum]
PVGLMALRGAVLHGAGRVFAVGSREKTVEVAKKYGATNIIDYHNGRISDQILEATGGQGVDKVLIAGGNAKDTFEEAVRMLKREWQITCSAGRMTKLGAERIVLRPA